MPKIANYLSYLSRGQLMRQRVPKGLIDGFTRSQGWDSLQQLEKLTLATAVWWETLRLFSPGAHLSAQQSPQKLQKHGGLPGGMLARLGQSNEEGDWLDICNP
eukprot:1189625-Amphidinium_carterae.1